MTSRPGSAEARHCPGESWPRFGCNPCGLREQQKGQDWKWNRSSKQSGEASHEGDTVNALWFRPAGIRIHGFRGMPMPELIQKGDKTLWDYTILERNGKVARVFCEDTVGIDR